MMGLKIERLLFFFFFLFFTYYIIPAQEIENDIIDEEIQPTDSIDSELPQPADSVDVEIPQPADSVDIEIPQPADSVDIEIPQPVDSVDIEIPQPADSVDIEIPQPVDSVETVLSKYTFGDINHDGEVSTEDFSLIIDAIFNRDSASVVNPKLSDFNEDGLVSISDLSYIIDFLKEKAEAESPENLLMSGIKLNYNLENRLVKGYLDLADQMYSDGIGRSGTSAMNYNVLGNDTAYFLAGLRAYPDDIASWEEQPAPVAFSVSPEVSRIAVSESPLFIDSLSFSCINDSAIIYNLIPDKIYWYRCYSDSLGLIDKGLFKTQGRVRMLACPNVRNVRDAGGWSCDGGHLAYGKLLRSGTLEFILPNDENERILCEQVGLSYEMDLRHTNETKGSLPDFSRNVVYGNYDLFAYMWLMIGKYWSESRQTVSNSSCRNNFGEAFKQFVINLEDGLCTDAHCSGGADRTGMFCFLVGALCGVSEEDLVKDWELTSFTYYYKWIDKEDLPYYVLEGKKYVNKRAELRSVCRHLYDSFGGKSGSTLKQQVESWFNTYLPDAALYIPRLRQQMIVPDLKSPVIVRDVSPILGGSKYTITDDSTRVLPSQKFKCLDDAGNVVVSPICALTDYIDCSDYSHILVNRAQPVVGAFYDSDYNYVGSLVDEFLVEEKISDCDYADYSIPEEACYVRFNMMKDSNITAVLSENAYVPDDTIEE